MKKERIKLLLVVLASAAIGSCIRPIISYAEDKKWIYAKQFRDDYNYGEVAIGTSSIYIYDSFPLMEGSTGYTNTYNSHRTNWEVTIVVDDCQETEYLIFKDTETGNICSVERRKFAQEVPESEKIYVE